MNSERREDNKNVPYCCSWIHAQNENSGINQHRDILEKLTN